MRYGVSIAFLTQLFTCANKKGQILDAYSSSTIIQSSFNKELPTKVKVHGFTSSPRSWPKVSAPVYLVGSPNIDTLLIFRLYYTLN